jgi:hypothetical protein
VAASSSGDAGAILWLTAREDTHAYPRCNAWQALIRREGLSACNALLDASESDDVKRDAFNAVFWDPKPDKIDGLADIAQSLLERSMPDAVRSTLNKLVRRARRNAGTARRGKQGVADAEARELDAYDPDAAARQLIEVGAITEAEAMLAVASARADVQPNGYVPVLEHCRLLSVFDVESDASPPWYAKALAELASNSRGRLRVDAVRQLWFDQRGNEPAVGIVQFVADDLLVEFAVHDRGDYYDMPALLGAVNGVLGRGEPAERFHALSCGDQLMAVVHATASAAGGVGRLIGMSVVEDADASMRAGRLGEAMARCGLNGADT